MGFYDRSGEPIEMEEWVRLIEAGDVQVATTPTEDGIVSTVWVGIDMGFGGGPPLIFESMVFGNTMNQEQVRYETEEDARAGHEKLVELVRRAEVGP